MQYRESFQPLNRFLYQRLEANFGEVKIANERQSMVAVQRLDPVFNRMRLSVVVSGEYYRVNCPFCNDTRHRLWVNHRFGLEEPYAEDKRKTMTYLAICYNENCLAEWENVRSLETRLFDHVNRNARRSIRVEDGEKPEDIERPLDTVPMPGTCLKLTDLDSSHAAVRYLTDRRFNVAHLEKTFGVSYCVDADDRWPIMGHRLVIPITMGGKRVGWQGRYIGDANWKFVPKYYGMPGMPKRRMIYNWDRVSQGRLAILVEGAPAVWGTDQDCSGAILGKTVTGLQQAMIRQWAAKYEYDCGLVLMLDPNAQDDVEGVLPDLNNILRGNVLNVVLPVASPDDLANEVLWETLFRRAKDRRFDIERYMTSVA